MPLKYPQKDLIIYEMHVRGFTKHESSKTEFPGTYLGVVEKLDHLKVKFLIIFRMTLIDPCDISTPLMLVIENVDFYLFYSVG